MKPANEIEIKRNVYTFSGIVLLLSVLIGGSAWTVSERGKADIDTERVKAVQAANEALARADTLAVDTTRLRKKVQDLKVQLDGAKDTALPRQIALIKEFIADAKGQSGDDLLEHLEYKKPNLGNAPALLATDLLNSTLATLSPLGRLTRDQAKAIQDGKKSGGVTTTNNLPAVGSRSPEPEVVQDPCTICKAFESYRSFKEKANDLLTPHLAYLVVDNTTESGYEVIPRISNPKATAEARPWTEQTYAKLVGDLAKELGRKDEIKSKKEKSSKGR